MSEKPLLCNVQTVRNFLEGKQSQDRRPMKSQPAKMPNGWWSWGYKYGAPRTSSPRSVSWHGDTWQKESGTAPLEDYAPYSPGDNLYVRETWAPLGDSHIRCSNPSCQIPIHAVAYKADGAVHQVTVTLWDHPEGFTAKDLKPIKWKPSIHCPKWAARLWLEVTGVRVERIQDISEEDAKAEGIDAGPQRARDWFRDLWDSLYPGSWQRNEFVWVYDLKKLDR